MALTDQQIQTKLNSLEKSIINLQNSVALLQDDIISRTRVSDLVSVKTELLNIITGNAKIASDLEIRLAKVLLPEETRFYLEEGEVEAFKSNFSKLKAMLSRFEQLYNNLVAYTSTRVN